MSDEMKAMQIMLEAADNRRITARLARQAARSALETARAVEASCEEAYFDAKDICDKQARESGGQGHPRGARPGAPDTKHEEGL